MSLETWKHQYLHLSVEQTKPGEAVAHSLKKWKGLRSANLEAHGMVKTVDGDIEERSGRQRELCISASSCSLCHHFYNDHSCKACPLALSRDGTSCVEATSDESESPWDAWDKGKNNPEPMIAALKKAKKWEKAQTQSPLKPTQD